MSDLPVATVARLSEVLTDLPGVDLEVQPIRDYPHGRAGSHLVGYVGAITQDEYDRLKYEGYSPNDVIGKDGLEFSYDRYLRGTPGGQRVVVDATGAVVSNVKLASKAPVPGDTLITSLDWRLQQIVENALADGVRRLGRGRRLSGAVVAEDPWTGGILALGELSQLRPERFCSESLETYRLRSYRYRSAALQSRHCRRDTDGFDV